MVGAAPAFPHSACSRRSSELYCSTRWSQLGRHGQEGLARRRSGLALVLRWSLLCPVRFSLARPEGDKIAIQWAECLVYSLTPSGVLAENHPKNRGFVGILRGQKCLKRGQKCLRRRFLRRSPVGEWSRGARSMPRVFGRGSRSQPAALVSDRDDAALFPAIRILERYGSAKSGRARRVRTACRRRGYPKRSSTICCRSDPHARFEPDWLERLSCQRWRYTLYACA